MIGFHTPCHWPFWIFTQIYLTETTCASPCFNHRVLTLIKLKGDLERIDERVHETVGSNEHLLICACHCAHSKWVFQPSARLILAKNQFSMFETHFLRVCSVCNVWNSLGGATRKQSCQFRKGATSLDGNHQHHHHNRHQHHHHHHHHHH